MGGKNSKKQLDDTIFNMRLASKRFAKESKRAENEEKAERAKAKVYLEKGVIESAQIHAENSIRKKNDSLNYLRLSSKMDAVVSRIQSATRTEEITSQFSRVIPQMNRVLRNMNLENIGETMGQFEKMFEDLDVASGYINESLGTSTAMSTPQTQVNGLLQQIASENNIEVGDQLGIAPTGIAAPSQQNAVQHDDLEARLHKLG